MILIFTLALAAPAAVQSSFNSADRGDTLELRWTFEDETGKARSVEVALPESKVERDNDIPKNFPAKDAAQAQAKAVREYADRLRGVELKVKASKSGTLSMSASGKAGKVGDALSGAKAVAEAELERWLDKHRYTRLRNDAIIQDHAQLAADYADEVAPLAQALAQGSPDALTYVARSLAFVQAIPYEKKKNGDSAGYRRPLSVLAKNKGDCDSKSTLFLALVRAGHPELASTVVYVPNHAFAGVALEPEAGERAFTRDDVRYVGVEPVGPAKAPIGDVSGKAGWHLFWGSAEAYAVP